MRLGTQSLGETKTIGNLIMIIVNCKLQIAQKRILDAKLKCKIIEVFDLRLQRVLTLVMVLIDMTRETPREQKAI